MDTEVHTKLLRKGTDSTPRISQKWPKEIYFKKTMFENKYILSKISHSLNFNYYVVVLSMKRKHMSLAHILSSHFI